MKWFALLRLPVSIICLLCLGLGVSVALASTGGGALGFVVGVGALVFMGVVTGKLTQCRPDALAWAGWLLALELLGVGLFLFTVLTETDFNFLAVGLVAVLWTLPNAVILYSQRRKFAEPAKEKPDA
jgi:hypothetical protein